MNLEELSWEEEFVTSHEDCTFGSADPSEKLKKLDTDVLPWILNAHEHVTYTLQNCQLKRGHGRGIKELEETKFCQVKIAQRLRKRVCQL